MSMDVQIKNLATALGAEVKSIRTITGDPSALSTTAKNSLVAAINELQSEINSLVSSGGAVIDDAATTGNTSATWSADKLVSELEAAKTAVKNELVGGAGPALDTLAEIAAALNNDASFAATIASEIANRVRYDAPQTLSAAQQLQACNNIGVGDPTTDFVAAFNSAKA